MPDRESPRTRHFIIDGTDESPFSILACTPELAARMHAETYYWELTDAEQLTAWREFDDQCDIIHNDDMIADSMHTRTISISTTDSEESDMTLDRLNRQLARSLHLDLAPLRRPPAPRCPNRHTATRSRITSRDGSPMRLRRVDRPRPPT